MAGRILTVKERGVTVLQYRLLDIQEANGYATTLKGVHRKDGNHIAASNPPEIYLYTGTVREQPLTTQATEDRVVEILPIEVRAFALAPKGLDREANLLVGDIQRCIPHEKNGGLQDPHYPNGVFWFVPSGHATIYSVRERGQIMTRSFFRMRYYYRASDPRLWADDDFPVHEEQMPIPE